MNNTRKTILICIITILAIMSVFIILKKGNEKTKEVAVISTADENMYKEEIKNPEVQVKKLSNNTKSVENINDVQESIEKENVEKETIIIEKEESKEEIKPNMKIDTIIKPKVPTLTAPCGDINGFELSILVEGNYSLNHETIDGWELYEKVNGLFIKYGTYANFDSVSILLEPGQERIFKARVYALDSNRNKVYSEYSNEIRQKREVLAPTLTAPCGDINGFELSILVEGNYSLNHETIDGWELYEKVNGLFMKYGTYANFDSVSILLEPGQERIFKARVYALDSNGNKVYSEYSNEIRQKREVLAPTLTIAGGDQNGMILSIGVEGEYSYGYLEISGWELYEKVDETFIRYGDYTNFSSESISLEPGQHRTFKARVYTLDNNGNKVYSDFSNEVTNL